MCIERLTKFGEATLYSATRMQNEVPRRTCNALSFEVPVPASGVLWAFRTKVGTLGAFYGLRVIRLAMSMRFQQEKAAQYPQVHVDTKR